VGFHTDLFLWKHELLTGSF